MSLINGLPAHILLVHVVVVLVPLTALAVVAAAVWPRAARRLGPLLPAVALVTLISVPLTTEAGEWLEEHVDSDPLVRRHAELGDGMLPWALGLFVLAALVWWATRRTAKTGGQGTSAVTATSATSATEGGASAEAATQVAGTRWASLPVRIILGVLSVAVAVGAVIDVYRIGDSGARAAWHDGFSKTPTHSEHDES